MKYFVCRALLAVALLFVPTVADAYTFSFLQYQAASANTWEATIYRLDCLPRPAENGEHYLLYMYTRGGNVRTDIPPFRVIRPGRWSNAIGGHDFATYQEAADVACVPLAPGFGGDSATVPVDISGYTWELASNCTWYADGSGTWRGAITLQQAANGALSGLINDGHNAEVLGTGGYNVSQTLVSRWSPPNLFLMIHPSGWESVLQLTGTLHGHVITGTVAHYTTDSGCAFTMNGTGQW